MIPRPEPKERNGPKVLLCAVCGRPGRRIWSSPRWLKKAQTFKRYPTNVWTHDGFAQHRFAIPGPEVR